VRSTVTVLSALAATALLAVPAHAAPTATGHTCSMSSTEDPSASGSQTGTWEAGPVTVADPAAPATPLTVQVVCRLGVNLGTYDQWPGMLAMQTPPGPTAHAVLPVTYAATAADFVYVCTELVVTTGTTLTAYYFDSRTDTFGTSDAVPCVLALSLTGPSGTSEAVTPASFSQAF
jgi:hypothetical protein